MSHPIHPPDAYNLFLLLACDLRETWNIRWAGDDHLHPDLYIAERRTELPEHARAVGATGRVAARDIDEFARRLRDQEAIDWSIGLHPHR
ncbi:hypothetical protein [Nocardiopsis suaedae]|uniref:Uncharacterized protein n=1 Tax=Nocardiopsis suaedae TaxID=3018444 RepID=A0ABT4TKA4_9ACTN|nr:hypothetical protein [Nocardiopsis suaedae]MDA2805109.1 hypothetical protein [Nocardiopsis suaedae]